MTTPEHDYGPDPQFAQTTNYLDRLLEAHGRAPVEGEIGRSGVESRMRIDPKGNGYRLNDIHIVKHTDGTHTVRQTYNTYLFDPRSATVINRYFMAPWTPYSHAMEPEISLLDDAGQRSLIVTISDALHNGNVVPENPIFPTLHTLRATLGRLVGKVLGSNTGS